MSEDIFRQILPIHIVEENVRACLRLWMEDYLREIELQWEVSYALERPRSYVTRPDNDKFIEEQLPLIVVVSSGTTGDTVADGDGMITATYGIEVAVVNTGPTKEATHANMSLYAAAVRAIILQQVARGGLIEDTRWTADSYDEGPIEDSRTIAVSSNSFEIVVSQLVNRYGGPVNPTPAPDTDPGSHWPTVTSTHLDVAVEEEA